MKKISTTITTQSTYNNLQQPTAAAKGWGGLNILTMNKKLQTIILATALYFTLWGAGGHLYAQNVNIPDANFKLALVTNFDINTNGDAEIQVSEAAAYIGPIIVPLLAITNLTGIEAFVNNIYLECNYNQLTSLNVSANTALGYLRCDNNQLTSLDVSANTALNYLDCSFNSLSTLNACANTALNDLNCISNQLTTLFMQNGNNSNITSFYAINNPALTCIQVDNPTLMNTDWSGAIDAWASFSTYCNYPTNCNAQFTLLADSALQSVWYLVNQCMGTDSLSADSLSYQWSWGDSLNSTATGAYPSFTYSSPGNYTICVTITDTTTGCTSTYCDSSSYISRSSNQMIQVNVVPANSPLITNSPNTSAAAEEALRCYPNPAKDVLNISLSEKFKVQSLKWAILDVLGNELITGNANSLNFTLSTLHLKAGIYFVRVGVDVKKLVKE